MIVSIESNSIKGKMYSVDLLKKTCTCLFFKFNKTCIHLNEALQSVAPEPVQDLPPDKDHIPVFAASRDKEQMAIYEKWCRQRVSKNFIIRDFMFSTEAAVMGLSNRPSDNLQQVEKSAKALCEKVLEPILEHFGRFAITFGYQSRQVIEAFGNLKTTTASSPHHWDRGTYGSEIYARIDILPFCVEDGHVTPEQFASWCMHNLDLDLLMQWDKSNVCCITIAPNPRRVWLKWVKKGSGDNGSNKIDYMGVKYWGTVFPSLPDNQKPKFFPSSTGGSLW